MIKTSTQEPGSAVEKIEFVKDGVKIIVCRRFSDFSVFSHDDAEINLDNYDRKIGAEMGAAVGYVEEEDGELIDAWVEGELDDEEKQQIVDAYNESLESGVQELGWQWRDRELWFYGPLLVSESE